MDPLHFIWRRFIWPNWVLLRSNNNARKAHAHYTALLNKDYSSKKEIRVAFLVNESSKWKVESLFHSLVKDSRYKPFVLLTCADIDWQLDKESKKAKLAATKEFFDRHGIVNEIAYDYELDMPLPLDRFQPDVVFYQHPWEIAQIQGPLAVSKFALTYYVPYFLPTYGIPQMEYRQDFHRQIFRHIVLNKEWADYYEQYEGAFRYAGELLPLGHPMIDVYREKALKASGRTKKEWVIYAPHWSIPHPSNTNNGMNLSTFLETGRPMLEYALRHPEIKWMFKPHPSLRTVLYKILPRHEVDDYYAQWERLGSTCYTGDYVDIFFDSQALITDCDSFLIEYVFTGNPIIHLSRDGYNVGSVSPFVELFETYYKVRDTSGLETVVDDVVLRHNDPQRELRLETLKKLNLCDHDASSAIVSNLDSIFFKDAK